MDKRQRILLYGNTLMLAGMRASLEANPAFEVVALDASQASGQDLLALSPTILIFDTASIHPQFYGDLIQQWTGVLLIGIDPDSNQVLLWEGQQMCELSVQCLVEVISQHQSHSKLFHVGKK
jgi:hypothetical protein